ITNYGYFYMGDMTYDDFGEGVFWQESILEEALWQVGTGGAIFISGQAFINSGELAIAGTINLKLGGVLQNGGITRINSGGNLFAEDRPPIGPTFQNFGQLRNEGTFRCLRAECLNESGSSWENESGAQMLVQGDGNTVFRNEAGASILNKAGATTTIDLGFMVNDGTFHNAGTLTNRLFFSTAGAFTNTGIVNILPNVHLAITPEISNAGNWANSGDILIGQALSANRGVLKNTGYFNHESGTLHIESSSTFDNEACGRFRHNGSILNENEFINNGHYYRTSDMLFPSGNAIIHDDMGFASFTRPVTANLTGATRLYVNKFAASGTNDGMSWANAITDLQPALQIARCQGGIQEIWVTSGNYFPSYYEGASFHVPSQITIQGGFNGIGNSLADANPSLYRSRLEGFSAKRLIRADGVNNTVISGFT
ncbi:MAG: hypothetical protein AAGA62_16175, partial [Bacteroidota bacterium]